MLATGDYPTNQIRKSDPTQAETTTPRVLTIISSVLEKLVARNDKLVEVLSEQLDGLNCHGSSGRLGKSLHAFHGVRAPNISIPKYLERIYKYTNCSPSCFVVGYVYIDRLAHKHPDSLVISLNVHRLLVTSVMVASKMLDDVHYNNAVYARVGGVTNAELNRLELELLFLLDFGVTVSSRVFENYCLHLEKEMLTDGAEQQIERGRSPVAMDDVTEISVEDTQSCSPPQAVD
ncbi:PREDICTED: cyclin-U1-1 [Theobroma cacao]|uniref:Cyclin n=2 Tax=Theobroma cacao TaxID=3641 RepID=A0A061E3L1_THECC|nr:PREDICTED: cyclin-U1-1 [Theobroma cacao]EOX99175.1 Cyclin p2,1 isoform 1 [Theobroma cacao]EOX99177.1 Cyclin p2,1 isoform 1 [Theobroma cacao]